MKKIILLTAITALFFTIKIEANAPAPVQFGIFYTSLAPHGAWLEIEPGFVVWRPTIMKRWSPYRDGRWVYTPHGWYWDSYEPFGYITYHYGRWYMDDYYGWIWVPDYEWGPAWVEWRYTDNYIGWAPLPPYATFSISVGIVFTNSYYTPYNHWHYVNYNRFCDPYPYKYYVAEKHKYRIHSKTKYRNEYSYRNGSVYNRGVDVDVIRQRSGREVSQRDIQRVSDHRDLRNSDGGRNDGPIRTFSPSRDDLSRGMPDNTRIEKGDRKSSLLTSKIEIGGRNRDNNSDRIRNDRTDADPRNNAVDLNKRGSADQEKRQAEIKRNNDSQTEVKRNNSTQTEVKRNSTPQNEVKRNTSTQNEVKRNTSTQNEVKRNTSTQSEVKRNTSTQSEVKRNTNTQTEKRNGGGNERTRQGSAPKR